jgi:hypothetical protein
MDSDSFRFCPELFALRTAVMDQLAASGFQWLSHFMSVDLLHDQYGVEVCGIGDEDDAIAIEDLLCEMFPTWKIGCLCCKKDGAEPGFKAKIFRDGLGFDQQSRFPSEKPKPREQGKADRQVGAPEPPSHKPTGGPDFLL